MERKIGETFQFQGHNLRVVEGGRYKCKECFFYNRDCSSMMYVTGFCSEEHRTDKKCAIFIEHNDEQPKLNLCEILKHCPNGELFWSPLLGDVKLYDIDKEAKTIDVTTKDLATWEINADGTITINDITSEVIMLYPSREQRDWTKVKYKNKKERFNPKTLQTFDKVLSRNSKSITWSIDFFSHMKDIYKPYQFFCLSDNYTYCIPYNDDTKHLVGTTEEAPEYYRYWED